MTEMVSHLTLYVVVYWQKGEGTEEQQVLASTMESAMSLVREKHPGTFIEKVRVSNHVVYWGDAREVTESEST